MTSIDLGNIPPSRIPEVVERAQSLALPGSIAWTEVIAGMKSDPPLYRWAEVSATPKNMRWVVTDQKHEPMPKGSKKKPKPMPLLVTFAGLVFKAASRAHGTIVDENVGQPPEYTEQEDMFRGKLHDVNEDNATQAKIVWTLEDTSDMTTKLIPTILQLEELLKPLVLVHQKWLPKNYDFFNARKRWNAPTGRYYDFSFPLFTPVSLGSMRSADLSEEDKRDALKGSHMLTKRVDDLQQNPKDFIVTPGIPRVCFVEGHSLDTDPDTWPIAECYQTSAFHKAGDIVLINATIGAHLKTADGAQWGLEMWVDTVVRIGRRGIELPSEKTLAKRKAAPEPASVNTPKRRKRFEIRTSPEKKRDPLFNPWMDEAIEDAEAEERAARAATQADGASGSQKQSSSEQANDD